MKWLGKGKVAQGNGTYSSNQCNVILIVILTLATYLWSEFVYAGKQSLPLKNDNLALGPTQEEVLKRLNIQLIQLKKIAGLSMNVETSELLVSNKPKACESLWEDIPFATVPQPLIFANTTQKKNALYIKLHEMAKYNHKLYLSTMNPSESFSKYKKDFNNTWGRRHDVGDIGKSEPICSNDGCREGSEFVPRTDTVHMLFTQTNWPSGAKRLFIAKVLLDETENGISLASELLLANGFSSIENPFINKSEIPFTLTGMSATSIEMVEPHQLSDAYSGIFSIKENIFFWSLSPSIDKNWRLHISPVHDSKSNKEIACEVKFDCPHDVCGY